MSDTNQDQIYINEIARALSERRAAIMVGSGFSKNASPKFPDGQELGKRIYNQVYKKEAASSAEYDNFPLLAEMVVVNQGRAALDSIIRDALPQGQFEPELHKDLLSLDWVDIFTTNYDHLLERTSEDYFPFRYDIVKNQDALLSSRNHSRIIKLHGDKDEPSKCIITDEDYRTYPREYPIFVNTIRQSLLENVFCLIGFSATDSNFLNWIGWLRDYFGQKLSQTIYLLGIKRPDSFHEKLFESRKIKFVDITTCIRIVDDMSTGNFDLPSNEDTTGSRLANAADKQKEGTNKHYLPIKNFLAYLKKHSEPDQITERQPEKSDEDFSILWNIASSPYPNPQNDIGSECDRIIKEWQHIRKTYPGWIVLPYRERNNLWICTQQWYRTFHPANFSKLSETLQQEFTYEIIWRINKCLYPIDEAMIEPCNTIINDTEWKTKETAKWFEIVLTLLREYRTTRNEKKWNELAETIQNEHSLLSQEQWSAFCHEESLNALFSVDTAKLRQTLDDWTEAKNAPLLEAKKAALWAELGELEKAKTIVSNALETVREQQKSVPSDKQTIVFSQEGCILSIYRCIEHAESFVQRKHDNTRHRLDALRQYRCDITEEQLVFSTALKHEPVPPPTAITVKSSFDIGTVNYTQHLFNEDDKEMLLGYSYLIFAEETGIPFRLSNVNFDKDSAVGAAKRIKRYNFHWAFITLLRTGEIKDIDTLFSRDEMASLKHDDADQYAILCMECLSGMQSDIARLNYPHIERNLAVKYAEIIPEILSRLCSKCSNDVLKDILDYLIKIYDLSDKDKQAFRSVDKLVKRLMHVFPMEDMRYIFDSLKKIADYTPNDNWLSSTCGFIAPHLPFANRLDNDFKPTDEDIEFALTQLKTHRNQGIGLCFAFRESFSEEQKQQCAELLWNENSLNASTGFPQSEGFPLCTFLNMPSPQGINVEEQFKKHSLEDIKGKDIFDNRDETTQTAANTSFAMTGGSSFMAQEWEIAYGIFARNPIELNPRETLGIYGYIRTYWNHHKRYLEERSNPFFSVTDEYKSRFQTLLRIFAFVVIPNAVKNKDEEIKEDIDQLLTEMSDAGLNIGLAKVASLALFPERQTDTQTLVRQVFSRFNEQEIEKVLNGLHVLLMMKHKEIFFEVDTHWAVDCIVEHIQNWLSPALYFALIYLADIIEKAPQFIEEDYKDQIIADILPTLEVLASETDMQKQDARIEFADRLTCRKACMRLASTIAKYYKDRNCEVPAEVQKWKNIADSTDEFWEIRNEWK